MFFKKLQNFFLSFSQPLRYPASTSIPVSTVVNIRSKIKDAERSSKITASLYHISQFFSQPLLIALDDAALPFFHRLCSFLYDLD